MKDTKTTNPKSTKIIVGVRLAEPVCTEHLGDGVRASEPYEGICYVCAVIHNEKLRA